MSFMDSLQKAVNDGLDASRKFLGKAADKAKELGEKGMLMYEVGQLKAQAEKLNAKLGTRLYEAFIEEKKASVTKEDGFEVLLQELNDILESIEQKEAALKAEPDTNKGAIKEAKEEPQKGKEKE